MVSISHFIHGRIKSAIYNGSKIYSVKSHQIDGFVKSSYARHANLEERGVLIVRRNDER